MNFLLLRIEYIFEYRTYYNDNNLFNKFVTLLVMANWLEVRKKISIITFYIDSIYFND